MYSLGYDIGSSFIKAALFDIDNHCLAGMATVPESEMDISSPESGMAEQDSETWWLNVKSVTQKLLRATSVNTKEITCIGLSYQMHGMVAVDKELKPVRPAIIWSDSRAVKIGNRAFKELGEIFCLEHFLNSPGNFTASKFRWLLINEPSLISKIKFILLPGDYIAAKMTGEPSTTISGLSEGIFWDFKNHCISDDLLKYYEISRELIPKYFSSFSFHGELSPGAAEELGLNPGTLLSYRAGDQPNNAYSLGVINKGEAAATAGTSGVIYAVTDDLIYDNKSRVNQFAHVNYSELQRNIGILLCINGSGSMYSWIKRQFFAKCGYEELNEIAAKSPVGANGITMLPFGNGAERIIGNKNIFSEISGIDFLKHSKEDFIRAAQEGVAFALAFGLITINEVGFIPRSLLAGNANMFLSPLFVQTLSNCTGLPINIYNTDGAQGAARGAAFGAGYYNTIEDSIYGIKKIREFYPIPENSEPTLEAFSKWKNKLSDNLNKKV